MKTISHLLFAICCGCCLLIACNDNKNDNTAVLENKRRIECERRVPACGGKDAMRFYQSVPLIQLDSNGQVSVTEVWSSFIICCEDFSRIMDTLTSFNHMFDSIPYAPFSVSKSDTIGNIYIHSSIWYPNEWNSTKRYEMLNFGDSTTTWSMPTGKYFEAHKRELEEAHARCCLL